MFDGFLMPLIIDSTRFEYKCYEGKVRVSVPSQNTTIQLSRGN